MSETSPFPGLAHDLALALEGRGFTQLTEVQTKALDPALAGRDLQIASRTGSGKTLACGFVIAPGLEAKRPGLQALLIAPTRELAAQVGTELSWLFRGRGLRVVVVAGGASVRAELMALNRTPAVVVGTPGRLLDHLNRGSLDAKSIGALVLDEADQLLDLGFRDELLSILEHLPTERRTHLVSATFSREVRALAQRFQDQPVLLEGTRLGAAHADIEHVVHVVKDQQLDDTIVNLLKLAPEERALLFVRTRAGAKLLTDRLKEAGLVAVGISGELSQRERNQALADFKRGQVRTLVATDVAARGLDVPEVTRVIHVAPPQTLEGLTHRSGRTGRAGNKGTSIILVSPQGRARIRSLLGRARIEATWSDPPGRREVEQALEARLFTGLAQAAAPSTALLGLAERLLAEHGAAELVAKLLQRSGVAEPTSPSPASPKGAPRRSERRPAEQPQVDSGRAEPRHPAPNRRQRRAEEASVRGPVAVDAALDPDPNTVEVAALRVEAPSATPDPRAEAPVRSVEPTPELPVSAPPFASEEPQRRVELVAFNEEAQAPSLGSGPSDGPAAPLLVAVEAQASVASTQELELALVSPGRGAPPVGATAPWSETSNADGATRKNRSERRAEAALRRGTTAPPDEGSEGAPRTQGRSTRREHHGDEAPRRERRDFALANGHSPRRDEGTTPEARASERPREDREGAGPRRPRAAARADRYSVFRINWGEADGADPRRVLALVCRRGRIDGDQVGAIRVGPGGTTFEVREDVAATFLRSALRPDPRNPELFIQALRGRGDEAPEGRRQPFRPRGQGRSGAEGGFDPPRRKGQFGRGSRPQA